jgi:hypothetical protein
VLVVGLGSSGSSGFRTRASTSTSLERRLEEKKSRLDMLKTLIESL